MIYLKFAFLSVKKNTVAFVLVILELAALILASNYALSTMIDRRMLIAPFKVISKDDSVYAADIDYGMKRLEFGVDQRQSRQMILDEISGNYKIYDVLSYTTNEYTIVSLNDEIYSHLKMPLSAGNYETAIGTFGTKLGEHSLRINGKELVINLSGCLTANAFIPMMSSFGTSDFNTKDLFEPSVNRSNVVVTNRSAIGELENDFSVSNGFFITFKDNYAENFRHLSGICGIVSVTDLMTASDKAIIEDIMDLLPVILCVLFLVIIGITSISVIINDQNEYRNGVMWLCGYSKRQILTALIVNISIMLIISILVSVLTLGLLNLFKIELAVTISLSLANFALSVILCLAMLFISLAIPVIKIARVSPIEYVRRAK